MNRKSNIVRLPDTRSIGMEASEWLVRLEDDEFAPDTLLRFQAWYNQSEKHKAAFNERAALWDGFNQIKALKDLAVNDRNEALRRRDERSLSLAMMGRRQFAMTAVASLVVFFSVGIFYYFSDRWGVEVRIYKTALGDQQSINLVDGSRISLNSDSEIEILYSRRARAVRLRRGEAYFSVAHNPDRAFTVLVDNKSVVAIGTAFSVRRLAEAINVTVAEGRVALYVDAADALRSSKNRTAWCRGPWKSPPTRHRRR